MANTLLSVFKSSLALNCLARVNNIGVTSVYAQKIRYLYAKSTLGKDGFEDQRAKIKNQMSNIEGKFKEKMSEYVTDESKNMIFTEDLKNMIHISETDKDIELVVKMMKRYNSQNKSLRFGNYIFGPVVMRMLYIHNKADLALQCFKSEELAGFFDQYMSYQLLLDLLYENQKYKELLEAFDIIKEKQLEGHKYPKNVIVLVLAACYRMNSKESLDYALKLWSELNETGHQPMRRSTTFCAGLALNQGKPEIALEVITAARNQNYTTVRNLKVAALSAIGRMEDVIPILKSVLNEDVPQGQQVHTFNKDVIERVRKSVATCEDPQITLEFNRLEQIFQKQGNIIDTTLDEQLCAEIQSPPIRSNREFVQFDGQNYQDNRNPMRRQNRSFERTSAQNTGFRQRRPGLRELV